ncbi:hypothetical protein K4F52_004223 [Lecanicillium sp. MT-2017a]|nr:hypothetical protein K4F52_004223 [Lecanicillium sp. MT-2017a]
MAPSQGRSRGLKTLQWLIRAAQLGASIIVMGIYVYFLVSLHDHNLSIPSSVPSVTGIAGAAILYDLLALLLLCRLAGRAAASFVAMLFDVAFGSAFIYVAVANKGGASQCTGQVSTVFGSGKDGDAVEGEGGSDFVKLPGLRTACKLQTACLAIAIILVFLFIFSALTEFGLGRNHQRQKRLAAKEENQAKYGQIQEGADAQDNTEKQTKPRGGFLGRLFGRKKNALLPQQDPNALPQHADPDRYNRASDGTDATAVEDGRGTGVQNKYETGYGYPQQQPYGQQPQQPYGSVVGDSYEHADDPYRQRYSFENPYERHYPAATTSPTSPYENPYVDHWQPEPQPTFQHNRRPVPKPQEYDDGIYDRP